MGIDIGLEGIGIYVRKGVDELFARSLAFDVPDAERLAERRQHRAARHCRKNRRVRLRRLDKLLREHGLPCPWIDKPESARRTDPLKLRFRALDRAQGLDSPEALSFCIRSCVAHRGYSYGGTEEGTYPWGEGSTFSRAATWLTNAYVTTGLAEQLQGYADELTAGKDAQKSREHYLALIQARLAWSQEHELMSVLREHHKGGKHDNLRAPARGFAFPQHIIWDHLVSIVTRHHSLIREPDAFLAALNINPKLAADKDSAARARSTAIFWYQRKTPFEMAEHWESKVARCPYAGGDKLNLSPPDQPCSLRSELAVRKWSMLEFAATRRVEVDAPECLPPDTPKAKRKKLPARRQLHPLSSSAVEALTKLAAQHHQALASGADRALLNQFKDRAKDIVTEDIRSAFGSEAKPAPMSKGKSPLWNATFFDQLGDLVAPSPSSLNGRASVCAAAAQRLHDIATNDSTCYQPELVRLRLNEAGYYDWKRQPRLDGNPFPQVELLLGRRIKNGPQKGCIASSVPGFLRRLFARLQKEGRVAQSMPDYCIIEVIGDPPRNQDQKKEILKEQKQRREDRSKRFEGHDLSDQGIASKRRRITLHAQQGGRCPYTGEELPQDPLSAELEIEHIFPDSMGGLTVEDNLVLTRRSVNQAKGRQTPFEWKGANGMKTMESFTQFMRWSAYKREIFTWGTRREDSPDGRWKKHYQDNGSLRVPDFGNTTRVSQLARQLRAEALDWMGLTQDFNEAARRIGTPSGWLAAQARKSWLPAAEYVKDRSNLTHHLIDAAILAHIPPGTGQNHVRCGGIFYNEAVPVGDTIRWMTFALPELSPAQRLAKWLPADSEYTECPVDRVTPRSKTKSIGDKSFWRQVDKDKPALAQRTALNPEFFKGDAYSLHGTLRQMKIPEPQIPSLATIDDWLNRATAATSSDTPFTEPLRLRDGTPVLNIWKFDGKGTIKTPLGWTGYRNGQGTLTELRSLAEKFDRLELWLGWNARSKRWEYQKRVIPLHSSLRHFKRMGFPWKQKLAALSGRSWRQEIVGKLHPFSKRVAIIRKEDVFQLSFGSDKALTQRSATPCWTGWYRVSAVSADLRIELASLVHKKEGIPHDLPHKPKVGQADDLAALRGLPPAGALAALWLASGSPPLGLPEGHLCAGILRQPQDAPPGKATQAKSDDLPFILE